MLSFLKAKTNTQHALNYVHSGFWGYAPTQFLGENKYFLSLIDDFTKKV